ncbi:MAG: nitroreductase family protein [Bacilli bacterium]|nr:nitroreductase family protein [Bacilli bacterium]
METINAIKSRRSHRKFSEEKINRETINKIIDASRFAPSWKNTQTVRYTIIENKNILDEISNNCVLGYTFNAKTISRCSALVVVSSITKISGYDKNGEFSTNLGLHWQSFDAGIATQTFCLAAHEFGVASVILGYFNEDKIKVICNLPENQDVMSLIAIGYPIENNKIAPKRLEINEIVNFIE